jgi:hypothetical protein
VSFEAAIRSSVRPPGRASLAGRFSTAASHNILERGRYSCNALESGLPKTAHLASLTLYPPFFDGYRVNEGNCAVFFFWGGGAGRETAGGLFCVEWARNFGTSGCRSGQPYG